MQKVIDSLNDHFPNLPFFNITKLFNMKHYLLNELDKRTLTEQWLNPFVTHFHWNDDVVNQHNVKICKDVIFYL